jgi:hypothetical protein
MKGFVAAVGAVTGGGLMFGDLLIWYKGSTDAGNLAGFAVMGILVLIATFIYAGSALD